MSEQHIKSFLNVIKSNFDNIIEIQKNEQLKEEFLKTDIDEDKIKSIILSSNIINNTLENISSEYKNIISDMIIHDSHNAGFYNGKPAGNYYDSLIDEQFAIYFCRVIIKRPNYEPEKLAHQFLMRFHFWTECFYCSKKYPMHLSMKSSMIHTIEFDEINACTHELPSIEILGI